MEIGKESDMAERVFMKGTEAIAEAAVRAGCRFFAGYPITPQNEIPEYMARRLPEVGGTFVQGESEVASVNMLYGAASTGIRAMSSSSSCGISLYSEGVSYCASARIPMVYVNVQRDQNPVLVLTDGVMGTMMEPVVLPPMKSDEELAACRAKFADRAIVGHPLGQQAFCRPGSVGDGQEQENIKAAAMYATWDKDIRVEEYMMDDAEIVFAAYGISARISRAVIRELRAEGIKAGMIRPITISPFPYDSFRNLDFNKVKGIIDVEMSIPAQMRWDIDYAVQGKCPVHEVLRSGGQLLTNDQVKKGAMEFIKEVL